MAKKKTKRKPDLDPAILEKVSILLITLRSVAETKRAVVEKLDVGEKHADAYIEAARDHLAKIASCDLTEEFGKALARLNDLYQRAVELLDVKTALATQKELNRLLDLRRPPGDAGDNTGGEMAAIRQHLEPLKLTDDPDAPTAELARLASLKILSA